MIISQILGGLGNQMFQYAVGRSLALRRHTTLKLDISEFAKYPLRTYDLHVFNIKADIANRQEIEKLRGRQHHRLLARWLKLLSDKNSIPPISYVHEKDITFQSDILDKPDNSYLEGYWQSEKYFSDIAAIIRQDFTLKTFPNPINQSLLNQIKSAMAISVHVRRGDYVNNAATNAFHGTTPLDYYQRAINYIKIHAPHGTIFVFSDDHTWVKQNLKFDLPTVYVDANDTDQAHDDLRLMSACRHHVLANSTFSWWGAWLGETKSQIVIAPKQWFSDPRQDARDLVPERWMKI